MVHIFGQHDPMELLRKTVYLDETASESPYLVSGWMAAPEVWAAFSETWRQELKREPSISYFRLNDALGLKGPFENWSDQQRDRKIIALAKTIRHDGSICGAGCYVHRDDFENNKQSIVREIYRDPYYFCVATTMIFMAAGECQVVGVDKIDFVLDKSKPAERMQRLFYSDVQPRFPKLGECLTSDDKQTPPLQAADLSVGMTRQLYEPVPRRIPGSYSLNGLFSGVFELHDKGLKDAIATPLFNQPPAKAVKDAE